MRFSPLLLVCLFSIAASPAPAQDREGGDVLLLAPVETASFVDAATGAPLWSDANYDTLIAAIEGLAAHGLNPDHYHLQDLKRVADDANARERLATDAWFSAAAHLLYGKLDALTIEPDWTAARREADLSAILQRSLDTGSVRENLETLAPSQSGYHDLKAEMARLRAQEAAGVTRIPAGETLKKGAAGARVAALRTRLGELGLLAHKAPGDDHARNSFDEDVDAAVKAFQTANDLNDDGIVGPASLAALNRGPQEKIDQLRVNLERWRWLPDELGARHVRVNIAGFSVTRWENGVPGRTHPAIVGKTYRKTPVFSDVIEYMIFNPWWETPQSIARKDKLPAFRKDPASVSRLGFQVLDRTGATVNPATIDWAKLSVANFPYRLRQAPGPQNALGQVKIMFPNKHNVYIHDTPTRELFSMRQRAFSSGCLRTKDPIDLAEWLLRDTPEWDRRRIDAALQSGKETRANLSAPIPVHVLYATAVAEEDGAVRYLDDVYDRDRAVLAGLDEAPGLSS